MCRSLAHVVRRAPIGLGDHLGIGWAEQIGQCLDDFWQLVVVLDGRRFIVVALEVGYLHHQHCVMRSHGSAAFGEDMRVRQFLPIAELLEHPDYCAGVLIDVVVNRTGIARMGAIVVDAEAAAHIDMVDRQPERAELGVITNGFTEAVTVVRQIGNLRAHVEVQQAHALLDASRAKALDDGQQLRSGQTELGLFTTGVGPLARSQ